MNKLVGTLVGLSVVATCGCVVKVNGQVRKFGLDGEEKVSAEEAAKMGGVPAKTEEDGKAASPDELAAELAKGTTPAGQRVSLKPDFSPNPSVLGTFSSKAEVNVHDQPHGANSCSGYVGTEPAAVLEFTSAMKNTRISAPGALILLAEFGDRKYICKEGGEGSGPPTATLDPEWPATPIKLFVGGRKGETYNYELRVEDANRPLDILWKSKVKTQEIAEVPKEPIVITDTTASTAGVKGRCGQSFFRDMPDIAFVLKRPLGDMSVEVRSAQPIDVQIVGPLNETGRNIPTNCLNDDRFSWNRMEAGMYGLRIGTKDSGAQVLYHIVVRNKDSARNPTLPPTKFVDAATVDESVVTYHYPQLGEGDLTTSDANREAVFLSAPKPLFVFPKFNMDKSVAEVIGGGRLSGDKNAPAPEYPKENEPLLLLNRNGYVMAADGSLFRVNMKDLQADPGGAIAIPAAPRNLTLSFDEAVRRKGPEDKKAFDAWEKAGKDVDACDARARSSFEGTFESMCSGLQKAEEKKQEALEKELLKNRTARRTASLAKIKPRLETVFGKK